MNKSIIISISVAVVALGIGFFGGMQYQAGKEGASGTRGAYFMRRGGAGGQFRLGIDGQTGKTFRPVRGQVLSTGNNTITVKLANGSSKIIVLAGSTTFQKSSTASVSDIKQGDTVMVVGQQNSDGSVTANNVDINPPTLQRKTSSGAAR